MFKVLYNKSAITIGKCIKIWQLIQAIKKADSDISTPADIQLKKPCHRLQKKLNIFSMPFPLQLRNTSNEEPPGHHFPDWLRVSSWWKQQCNHTGGAFYHTLAFAIRS